MWSGSELIDSTTSFIHVCADYIDSAAASFTVEPFLDLHTKTFFEVSIKTTAGLVVPQGYDDGKS